MVLVLVAESGLKESRMAVVMVGGVTGGRGESILDSSLSVSSARRIGIEKRWFGMSRLRDGGARVDGRYDVERDCDSFSGTCVRFFATILAVVEARFPMVCSDSGFPVVCRGTRSFGAGVGESPEGVHLCDSLFRFDDSALDVRDRCSSSDLNWSSMRKDRPRLDSW